MPFRAAQRDPATPADLAAANVSLVYGIAQMIRRHRNLSSQALDDLVGDGMVGLMQAAQRFDQESGNDFRKYASARVAGEMSDGFDRWTQYRNASARAAGRHWSIDYILDEVFETEYSKDYNPLVEDALATVRSPEDPAVAAADVQRILADMPPRLVVVAKAWADGTTIPELAARLGVSENWTTQLRGQVRAWMAPLGPHPPDTPPRPPKHRGDGYYRPRVQHGSLLPRVSAKTAATQASALRKLYPERKAS